MSAKPIRRRPRAQQDIEAAAFYYAREAGSDVAVRFVEAVEEALRLLGVRPASGSPRFAHELELPGLRARKLKRFPHLVFYVERADHIDVQRVLHAQRDIAASLTEDE